MKLGTKLIRLSFFTILIPMLIIGGYAALLLNQNTEISQWEFMEDVGRKIEDEVLQIEIDYLTIMKQVADNKFFRDKVYFYHKYWNLLSESIINYDLTSFIDFIEEQSVHNNIETIALYRKSDSGFNFVTSTGPDEFLPDELFEDNVNSYIAKEYIRYYDGIYLRITYPVFSDGRFVGILLFMKGYNETFFSQYTSAYSVEIALRSKQVALYNSNPDADKALTDLVIQRGKGPRINFNSKTKSYTGVIVPYQFNLDMIGELVLYNEKISILSQSGFLVQKLLFVVLLCILIPVIAFFIKEIRLIRTINSLVVATDKVSKGDYSSSVEISNTDEIGTLGRNFNSMVSSLKKSKDSLEYQNSELALKNSYIDAVFQSLQINIIVINGENEIQVVSKNISSRLELTDDQIGKNVLTVSPFSENHEVLSNALETVWAEHEFYRLYSIQFGDNSFEIDFYPVKEDDGEIRVVVMILNNITEKLEMERALVRSDRLASVGQLAAGLAHEINNPMSIISNHLELLKSGKLSKSEEIRFMGRVETEVSRVGELIKNLLTFSREEKHSDKSDRLELLNPHEIINEVICLFDPQVIIPAKSDDDVTYAIMYHDKRVKIHISKGQEVVKIYCAKDPFKQIILNILKNALDSLEMDGGELVIGLEKGNEKTKIFVSDNGIGISESDLKEVFDPFFSRYKTGTGLGLSLCKSMMLRCGGSITIDSIKDKGTTVNLYFPLNSGKEFRNG
jgi:signal transduction histidine kinase/HAMP domain-containing protein